MTFGLVFFSATRTARLSSMSVTSACSTFGLSAFASTDRPIFDFFTSTRWPWTEMSASTGLRVIVTRTLSTIRWTAASE